MANESLVALIENLVKNVLEELPEYFLVQVRIKPTNNIKVFLDGDNGIPIEACIRINRKLYPMLEEHFPEGDFSLEVSSPGVGEPLLLKRQYTKNIGRFVEVKTNDAAILEGKLVAVEADHIEIETSTGKGKKLEIKQQQILFSNIKSTIVQIKF